MQKFHNIAKVSGNKSLVSGLVSLTLTPMLCSRFLKPTHDSKRSRFDLAAEGVFNRLRDQYERTLYWVMEHRRTALMFSAGILVGTVVLFMLVPKGFLPSEDNAQIQGTTETAEGTSFDSMIEHQRQIAAIVARDPNVLDFMSSVGGGGRGNTGNQGRLFIHLKPRSQRRMSADEVIRSLQPRLSVVPGMRVFLQNPPPINVGARNAKSLYQFTLQSTDIEALYASATQFEGKMRGLPELQDVTSDLQIKNPQVNVAIDRDRAAALAPAR